MPDEPTQTPGDTGRERLLGALRPSTSRGQVVVGLMLAILGFLAVVQVQTLNSDSEFAGARREDLLSILEAQETASRQVREDIEALEARRAALQDSSDRSAAAIEEASAQIEVLGILAGTIPADGPGIVVTINDPAKEMSATTVLNALEEMQNAGAEAIEINNTVRVVASTPVTDTPGGITVGDEELRPPYVFDVIGPPASLETAMSFPGGLIDQVAELRGQADVAQTEEVEITSLHTPESPEYAQPAD